MPGIRQPVLLLADPDDTLIPVRTTHQLAAMLPDARVQLLSQVGHHLPRRAAAEIAAAIVQFLAALDSRHQPDLHRRVHRPYPRHPRY